MALNKTLLQLTDSVRAECRRSTSASRGNDDLEYLHQVIRRNYEMLYDDYDWPHLKVLRDVTILAGSYHYDFPDDLNFTRVNNVRYNWGDIWTKVEYGITDEEFSSYDPENNERADPIEKWDIIDTGTAAQLEVWPLPASSGTLRLRGIKALNPLVSNDDTCDIDDILVVLSSSAEILAGAGQSDAEVKSSMFRQRLNTLKTRNFKRKSMNLFGEYKEEKRPPQVRVVYSGGG